MKAIILALVLAAQVMALIPAFQSIVSPRLSSPFSSYSFDVINTNNNPNPYFQTFVSSNTNGRIVYIPSSAFADPNGGIGQFLNKYSGQTGVPSILRLKDFTRTIDGSSNNQKHGSRNQAKTGLARHCPPLYKDGR